MVGSVVYLLSIILTLLLLTGLLAYAWRFRYARGAGSFQLLTLGAMGWTLLVGVMAIVSPPSAPFWLNFKYFFIAFEPVPVLLFVIAFSGGERMICWRRKLALCLIPAVTQGFVWTNDSHQLMLRGVSFTTWGDLTALSDIRFGPWYWVHALYGYALVLASLAVVGMTMFRGSDLIRRQSLPIFIGVCLPLVSNVLLITGTFPRAVDPMPFGLLGTAVLFAWGAFRYHLLDLVPVARARLVDALNDGMLVLDGEGRVIDMNPSMREITGAGGLRLIGGHAAEMFARDEAFSGVVSSAMKSKGECVSEIETQGRHFEVRSIPLDEGKADRRGGVLIVFHDRTLRKQMEHERELLIGELKDALAEVRTLSGMLPVCANCKKVRDDEGYWHGVDIYIREHSDAEVTHGICPECHEKLYPEYSNRESAERDG